MWQGRSESLVSHSPGSMPLRTQGQFVVGQQWLPGRTPGRNFSEGHCRTISFLGHDLFSIPSRILNKVPVSQMRGHRAKGASAVSLRGHGCPIELAQTTRFLT